MLALALLFACGAPPASAELAGPPAHDHAVDPAGCASQGCGAPDHADPNYTSDVYADLLRRYAEEAPGAASLPLETLLFHGHTTDEYVELLGTDPLPVEHDAVLRRELARHAADVQMRLVDASGVVRATMASAGIPLKEKQHLAFGERGTLQHFEASGKVKRVGLHHLWSRW